MKTKEIFVLFSGGLDSTFLIQKLLSEPYNTVVSAYSEIMNNPEKTSMELDAISKIVPIFEKKFPNRYKHLGISTRTEVYDAKGWIGLEQMPVWINTIFHVTPKTSSEIAIGYVMNDCAISYLDDFKKLIKCYSKMTWGKFPKLTFPLAKWDKQTIKDHLDYELHPHVVWCEMPVVVDKINKKYTPCGKCVSCKHSPLLELRQEIEKEKELAKKVYEFPIQYKLDLRDDLHNNYPKYCDTKGLDV